MNKKINHQSYFIGEKDERKIVSYNKACFSRIVMNHYRKDNSIRSVITGKSNSWYGWVFKEIIWNLLFLGGKSPQEDWNKNYINLVNNKKNVLYQKIRDSLINKIYS